MANQAKQRCVSCGNQFYGRFCNQCGEKVLEASERSVVHFLLQVLNEVTSLESKLWSTLKTIILRPGQLSSDYSMGRRNLYMRPVTLFFLGNLIYFLFPILDTFNTLLEYQYNMPYTSLANVHERVEQAIAASGLTLEGFHLAYNQATEANSKLLLICLVPLMVPIFVLVGRSKRRLISDHLIIALEYNIFVLYINTMLLGYCLLALHKLLLALGYTGLYFSDFHLTTIAAILSTYFLSKAIRRFYRYSWLLCGLLSVITLLGTFMSLMFYRWILFEVTLNSI